MRNYSKLRCKVEGCREGVMPSLTQNGMCLDHYLDEAMHHLGQALENCKLGQPVQRDALELLVEEADFATNALATSERGDISPRRERMLELVLGVANLHEYLRRNVLLVAKPN